MIDFLNDVPQENTQEKWLALRRLKKTMQEKDSSRNNKRNSGAGLVGNPSNEALDSLEVFAHNKLLKGNQKSVEKLHEGDGNTSGRKENLNDHFPNHDLFKRIILLEKLLQDNGIMLPVKGDIAEVEIENRSPNYSPLSQIDGSNKSSQRVEENNTEQIENLEILDQMEIYKKEIEDLRGRKRDLSKNVSELKRELKRKDKEHNYQIEELENKFNSKILEIQVEFENKFSERDAENELIADVMKMRESPELKDSPHIYNKSPEIKEALEAKEREYKIELERIEAESVCKLEGIKEENEHLREGMAESETLVERIEELCNLNDSLNIRIMVLQRELHDSDKNKVFLEDQFKDKLEADQSKHAEIINILNTKLDLANQLIYPDKPQEEINKKEESSDNSEVNLNEMKIINQWEDGGKFQEEDIYEESDSAILEETTIKQKIIQVTPNIHHKKSLTVGLEIQLLNMIDDIDEFINNKRPRLGSMREYTQMFKNMI